MGRERRAARLSARDPGAKPNGKGASFAINEHCEIGITRGAEKMALDADEFARLRSFIERTEPIWSEAL